MSKRFRECSLDQPFLMPPSLQDWLPEDHLARFIAEVVDTLDLSAIYAPYGRKDGRGLAAYHPLMLTRLLLYAYATGRASSRQIEQGTHDDLAFRYLAADQHPDHDTIAQFRQQHLESLARLFVQALRLCQRAGLVKLGNVAIDGTKIRANASAQHSLRYQHLKEQEQHWQKIVAEMLVQAARADEEEDQRYGKGQKASAVPPELAAAQARLNRLRQAQQELEQEARQEAEEAQRAHASHVRQPGRPTQEAAPAALDQVQRWALRKRWQRAKQRAAEPRRHYNFTDPASRMMWDNGMRRPVQGYNAQLGVDAETQVILAADVTQQVTDQRQLVPMVEQVRAATGSVPACVTADAGYWHTAQLVDERLQGIHVLVAPERSGPTTKHARVSALAVAMRERLRAPANRKLYAMRQASVEPVLGQIKELRRFRRFQLRGLEKVRAEWNLICLTHNLLKLFRHSVAAATA
jgi:transposase